MGSYIIGKIKRHSASFISFDGYRDFVIAMLPDLEHLDGTDIEHGERIRAVQRLDELRPLIASQEKEYRRGIEYKLVIYQLFKLIAKFFYL